MHGRMEALLARLVRAAPALEAAVDNDERGAETEDAAMASTAPASSDAPARVGYGGWGAGARRGRSEQGSGVDADGDVVHRCVGRTRRRVGWCREDEEGPIRGDAEDFQ